MLEALTDEVTPDAQQEIMALKHACADPDGTCMNPREGPHGFGLLVTNLGEAGNNAPGKPC